MTPVICKHCGGQHPFWECTKEIRPGTASSDYNITKPRPPAQAGPTTELDRAKQLVRDIVTGIWNQSIPEETVTDVAHQILKALPHKTAPYAVRQKSNAVTQQVTSNGNVTSNVTKLSNAEKQKRYRERMKNKSPDGTLK